MVKHTQTIRRQKLTNCLSVFDHFVGLALKGLKMQIFYNWKISCQKLKQKKRRSSRELIKSTHAQKIFLFFESIYSYVHLYNKSKVLFI